MGHTLVTRITEKDRLQLQTILQESPAESVCKIPYGRKCDRAAADRQLPYHITLAHWGKEQDALYLPRLEQFTALPCAVSAVSSELLYAEEGSLLLYLAVQPADGFAEMCSRLASVLQSPVSYFLHMTLAVSKNHEEILQVKEYFDNHFPYPGTFVIPGLDLYHIWEPVYKAASFDACPPL